MKKFYSHRVLLSVILQAVFHLAAQAQCIGGSSATPVFVDTTIRFEPGVTSTQVKFPQFDPETGMLSCVKLTVTMTGIIDTVYMQNLTYSTQAAQFNYERTDEMLGPGLKTSLKNSAKKNFGPYTVTSFDENFTSGTDYASIPRDTVVYKTVVRTLTDSTEISQFYGHDSVTYQYNIDVKAIASMTGGNSMFLVRTSASVRFRFEYCKCPKSTLPLGVKNFTVNKTGAQTANLYWEGQNDQYDYNYDIQMSRDGRQFATVATVDRKHTAAPTYLYSFAAKEKALEFVNPVFANVSLYPNPSAGTMGLKFVNAKGGRMTVQVANASGRLVMVKDVQVAETDYKLIGQLPKGLYWVKIIDAATRASCVKQLVVQ
jgi:hypothetical protein